MVAVETETPSLNARDASALLALQTLSGPDGWVRARARGQLLDASGVVSWEAWRRAVRSLASAGHLEVGPAIDGGRGSMRAYRVLTTARPTRSATPSDTFSDTFATPPLKTPEGLILNDLNQEKNPPEGVSPDTFSDTIERHVCRDASCELASAIRYLADTLAAALKAHAPAKPGKSSKAVPAVGPTPTPPSPQAALFEGVPAEPEKPVPVDIPALATNIMKAWRPPKDQIRGTPGIEPSGQQRVSSRAEIEKALASALSKADDPRAEAHAILGGVKAYAAVKRTPEERTRVPAEVPWINQRRWTIPIVVEAAPKQRLERGELTDAPTFGWKMSAKQIAEKEAEEIARQKQHAKDRRNDRIKAGTATPEEIAEKAAEDEAERVRNAAMIARAKARGLPVYAYPDRKTEPTS